MVYAVLGQGHTTTSCPIAPITRRVQRSNRRAQYGRRSVYTEVVPLGMAHTTSFGARADDSQAPVQERPSLQGVPHYSANAAPAHFLRQGRRPLPLNSRGNVPAEWVPCDGLSWLSARVGGVSAACRLLLAA